MDWVENLDKFCQNLCSELIYVNADLSVSLLFSSNQHHLFYLQPTHFNPVDPDFLI